MSNISDQIRMDALLESLRGQDISNLTIINGTCEQCKHNKKYECKLGHRNELREPSTFCCMDFIKEERHDCCLWDSGQNKCSAGIDNCPDNDECYLFD